ncbi:MAG TPA: glycoside hydrolase family 57 protein [Candidatus Atribacteria bacterium]|nr:glycoside hydrolase family 57 protein [Candidatus Atribacteria bacterium]HQE24702.1 glycoside hydrolase family 57 protein [Candidatus Atribacteria bacterium]
MTEKLMVNIVWHMHQPFYWNEEKGFFDFPWVRTHATKDYLFMGKLVEKFPSLRVTFNFSPSLLRQFQLYLEGREDEIMKLAKKRASSLTEEDKRLIKENFFVVVSPRTFEKWPRFAELKEKPVQYFTSQDFLDLQVLYQLIWFDPLWREENPVGRELWERGRNYREEDKEKIWRATDEIFREIFSQYRKLLENKQIEISFSPFYHPILPLLIDTDVARQCNPATILPHRFSFPEDAREQIKRGKDFSQDIWGSDIMGMWPSEGAVSEEVLSLAGEEGVGWLATGEEILFRSLGKRKGEAWPELYLPHVWEKEERKVAVFFRDTELSDLISFSYQHFSPAEAVEDLIQRLKNIKKALPQGKPYLVTIILDGENAWEYYVDNGLPFITSLYQALCESEDFVTITPREYLQKFSNLPPISHMVPGSWVGGVLDTWIGHPEKNWAWEELRRVRELWGREKEYLLKEEREKIQDLIYQAEGSDWFWWLGDDNPSLQKESFRQHFLYLIRSILWTLAKEERECIKERF